MKDETHAELLEATAEMYAADVAEKSAKTKKEKARSRFMKLASKALLEERPLRKQTVTVSAEDLLDDSDESIQAWISREYPEWRMVDCHISSDMNAFEVQIEEDPDLMKFTFVNDDLKKVFGRTVETRGAYFDSSSMREEAFEDPDVWEIIEPAWEEKTVYEFNELHAQLLLSTNPSLMPLFQRHNIPGKVNAKLTPIRNAKEEEVELS